jgi:hypothetical protein
MGTRFIKNYKLWFWTPLTNTIAGDLLHKCVKKGKFWKIQRCPNYFLSKHDLFHLVTHENRMLGCICNVVCSDWCEEYALFKNKVDLFEDYSQKLICTFNTVLSNLFQTLWTHCIKMLTIHYVLHMYNFNIVFLTSLKKGQVFSFVCVHKICDFWVGQEALKKVP